MTRGSCGIVLGPGHHGVGLGPVKGCEEKGPLIAE